MNKKFHNLVRGIVIDGGKVLLAREINASNTFLPGGHIEVGESAEVALRREVLEELGCDSFVGRYVGALESGWGEIVPYDNYEMNHIFTLKLIGIDSSTDPKSLEGHLEFIWAAPDELKNYNLLPNPLVQLLESDEFDSYKAWWASTIRLPPDA